MKKRLLFSLTPLFLVFSLLTAKPARAGFNGDTFVDAIFANVNVAENRVCAGNGAGGFTCSNVSGDTNDSFDVAVGDVNNNGDLDAVFANDLSPNRVCLGDGLGGFTCGDVSTVTTKITQGVALGDVNNDGDLDAVFANGGNSVNENRVCLGDGLGGFTCSDVSTDLNSTQGVALGDVDQDGNLDAIFANLTVQNRVCLGDGLGGFSCSDVSTDTNETEEVALGDVNNDGDLDAVFATAGISNLENRVCLGDGSGGFSCSDVSTDTLINTSVDLGDMDGDGFLDAIFGGFNTVNQVCLGDGTGAFPGGCVQVSADTNATDKVAVGDVNRDGLLDAVFANVNALQANRVCLGNGTGAANSFSCSDVSAAAGDLVGTHGVALTPSIANDPAPTALDFPNQPVGTNSPAKITQITNAGTAPLLITNVYLAGTDAAEFNILNDTCAAAGPIPGSASCVVQVEFSPTSAGVKLASVHFIENVETTVVTLTGTAVLTPVLLADLSVEKIVDTPEQNVNGTVIFLITVHNGGPDDATNVVVTDQLVAGPNTFTVDFITPSVGSCLPAPSFPAPQTITCTLGGMDVDDTEIIEIVGTIDGVGQVDNTAVVADTADPQTQTPATTDPDPFNNFSVASVIGVLGSGGCSLTRGAVSKAWVLLLLGGLATSWILCRRRWNKH